LGRLAPSDDEDKEMMRNFSDEARSIFLVGLRNAHGMENQALSIMKPQASRIEHYPAVAQRLEQHIRETEGQIQRLETILGEMDEDPSTFKDTVMSMIGSMTAVGHSAASDEIIKNSLANYAFEHYEMAAYKSLLTLAEAGGMQQAMQLLQQNLAEEQAMAEWIDQNLRSVTLQYANLRDAGESAKV
jgi:ferritin-like metal-binding protein YciE